MGEWITGIITRDYVGTTVGIRSPIPEVNSVYMVWAHPFQRGMAVNVNNKNCPLWSAAAMGLYGWFST